MPLCQLRSVLPAAFLICLTPVHAQSTSQPIQLSVDVTDAPRKIIHAVETMPITPGAHTLVYPKWIPGEHGPTGPIDDLTGLVFTANGQQIPWRRDDVDMFAFHIDVPAGATELKIKLDFLATALPSGFSSGASTSASLAMLSWNTVLLYPEGAKASDVMVTPAAKIPQGWQYGTALTKTGGDSYDLKFETVSLEQLVDSPLLTGRYFREWPLAPEVTPKHFLDVAADGPEDLEIKPDLLAGFNNLVREAGALYKSRHYGSYHFLLTASDQVAHFGLEHHQSSDDRIPEKTFIDPNLSLLVGMLLPHEFTHSWNGITNGGWRLAYSDKETQYVSADEHGGVNAWWSLGLRIGDGGKVSDVLVGSLVDKAGFGPDMQIVAVNGRAYQDELLKRAINDAKEGSTQQNKGPIEFIVSNTSYFKMLKIDYHGGQRYPYLEQVKGEKNVLDEILKPMAPVKK